MTHVVVLSPRRKGASSIRSKISIVYFGSLSTQTCHGGGGVAGCGGVVRWWEGGAEVLLEIKSNNILGGFFFRMLL